MMVSLGWTFTPVVATITDLTWLYPWHPHMPALTGFLHRHNQKRIARMPSSLTPFPFAPMPLAQLTSTTQSGNSSVPAPAPATPVAPAPAHPSVEAPAPTNTGVVQAPTTQGATPTTGPKESPSPFGGLLNMLPIILMFVVLYLSLYRGQKKEEKRRKVLISEMKRGDKVQTIGGLVASVVSIDDDEVVLKVDESANVKETYKKSAILTVIVPGGDKKSK
jgi:preprotein translocase subunit YajC